MYTDMQSTVSMLLIDMGLIIQYGVPRSRRRKHPGNRNVDWLQPSDIGIATINAPVIYEWV